MDESKYGLLQAFRRGSIQLRPAIHYIRSFHGVQDFEVMKQKNNIDEGSFPSILYTTNMISAGVSKDKARYKESGVVFSDTDNDMKTNCLNFQQNGAPCVEIQMSTRRTRPGGCKKLPRFSFYRLRILWYHFCKSKFGGLCS